MMVPRSTKYDNAHVITSNHRTVINGGHQLLETGYKQAGALKHQRLILHTLALSSTEITYVGALNRF